MALVDDLSAATPEEELSRRKLLGSLSGAALGVAGIGTAITSIRYMRPNVLFEAATRFKLGRPEEIPVGTLLVLTDRKLYVVHTEEGFVALSAECTHLGCMTRWDQASEQIVCPCHGSNFSKIGGVASGPAPRPLIRLSLEMADGQLVVDTRQKVADDFVLRA